MTLRNRLQFAAFVKFFERVGAGRVEQTVMIDIAYNIGCNK